MVKIKWTGYQLQAFDQPWSNGVPVPPIERAPKESDAVDYLLWIVTELREEIGELKARLAVCAGTEG